MSTGSLSNNKRIAKNTLLLYFRMFLLMGISLFTSRVTLQVLGVEDFGIYNVVGGFVVMFSILTSSLTSAITLKTMNNHVVIMAGDVGSRFWSLSTPEYPKQFS